MLCSSMKLADRKEAKQEIVPKRNKSKMLEEKLFMKSEYHHSYTFRWEKPKKFYNCDSVQFLTVNNIILPDNAQTFNTGSSIEKWSQKRPRLKTTKQKHSPPDNSKPNCDDNFDETPLMDELAQGSEDDVQTSEMTNDSGEIDPDIVRLLSVVQDSTVLSEPTGGDSAKQRRKKHRHKRKDKNTNGDDQNLKKEKLGKRRTKTIKFSLTKPPSPSTTQVIRVDVTSNYSFEEIEAVETNRSDANISDCSKGCGKRIRSAKNRKIALSNSESSNSMENASQDMKIECNKLTLSIRK